MKTNIAGKTHIPTGAAANLLGLSVTVIISLFDNGDLQGFKIPHRSSQHPHRRISVVSLWRLARRLGIPTDEIEKAFPDLQGMNEETTS